MSDSAVQPWKVRKTEHMVELGYCGPDVRYAASHGSYCSTVPSNRCRNACWYALVIHRSSEPTSTCEPRPPELAPGGRRRMRSGYSESRSGSNHWLPSDSYVHWWLRNDWTAAMRSLCRASIWARDQ